LNYSTPAIAWLKHCSVLRDGFTKSLEQILTTTEPPNQQNCFDLSVGAPNLIPNQLYHFVYYRLEDFSNVIRGKC
jgi:hypothetical protein